MCRCALPGDSTITLITYLFSLLPSSRLATCLSLNLALTLSLWYTCVVGLSTYQHTHPTAYCTLYNCTHAYYYYMHCVRQSQSPGLGLKLGLLLGSGFGLTILLGLGFRVSLLCILIPEEPLKLMSTLSHVLSILWSQAQISEILIQLAASISSNSFPVVVSITKPKRSLQLGI
jgi:hypothetical protein